MRTKELKIIIETAEQLGHYDINLVIDDSRDGQKLYPTATAKLIKTGNQMDPHVVLAVSYE